MKCEKCGGNFPHKKGRYCGTCNWNSPTFDAAIARRKREGKKLGHHLWPNGTPAPKERSGGFSMTIMEMEEYSTIKAQLEKLSIELDIRDRACKEALLQIERRDQRIAELEDVLQRNDFHELSKNCWCLKSGGCL